MRTPIRRQRSIFALAPDDGETKLPKEQSSEAESTVFGELVASGWHTAAITMRLLVESGLPIAGGLVGAGGEITWPSPVRPGAVLQVKGEILEVRPSRSRPDRGIVTVRSETRDQHSEVVQVLIAKLVVPRGKL